MCLLGYGLMSASPERQCNDMGGMNLLRCEAGGDAPDFLYRPADQLAVLRHADRIFFWGSKGRVLVRLGRTAIIANASITSETWRCQPCQERVSLWSRPNSCLAVSKLSSIAQRCYSTVTSFSTGVPTGR